MEICSSRLLYKEILSERKESLMGEDHMAEIFRKAFHQLVGKSRPVSAELFCRLLKLMVFDREVIAFGKMATLVTSADREHCKACFEKDPSDFDNLLLYSIVLLVSRNQKRGHHLLDRLYRSGWEHKGIAWNIRELSKDWSIE